jgi:hypothetical protein
VLATRAADAVRALDLDAATELYGAAHALGTATGHTEIAELLNGMANATLEVVTHLTRTKVDAPPARSLVVSRHGRFFRIGAGSLVVLAQRAGLARMVVALAHARLERPGEVVRDELLTEAAWPGERLVAKAGKNRLHVAVATLRKLGLRPVLERHDGGYLVPHDVTTLIVD